MGLVYWLPAFLRTDFLYGMSALSFFKSLWREVEKEMNKLKNDLENGMFLAAGMFFSGSGGGILWMRNLSDEFCRKQGSLWGTQVSNQS